MDVFTLIMAGGTGKHLSVLTAQRTEAALPFAGKYRIIDFSLSNTVNSGLFDVAVLTQYLPLSLNKHIGTGKPWDLDRRSGGIQILHPYLGTRQDLRWDRGTADAVFQHLDLLREIRSEYVLILAGDHIYKMDYRPLIQFHKDHKADLTVAVISVLEEEASRFGIATLNGDWRMLEFQEKPRHPQSHWASMGVYVFKTELLIRRLEEDAPRSSGHDFGKDIIPTMVERDRVFAYPFTGYWMDVGTVPAYYGANMALLQEEASLNLYDKEWIIHTRDEERPPVKFTEQGRDISSLISNGCVIQGKVEHSVLSPGVMVDAGAVVRNSVIMNDSRISAGAIIENCIIDKEVIVGAGARLGVDGGLSSVTAQQESLTAGLTIVGKRAHLPANVVISHDCILAPGLTEQHFQSGKLESGTTLAP
ncbi:MAG: glucose-1-phosphate adenylyltransferase subunit GlgD [Chloroflexi bacterium]|nr:glucose-1-phosphate adenylyltransferase subunit GlgD [Chloroflexota bacterium]